MAKDTRIDLNEEFNSTCKQNCNREERRGITEDDLCNDIVSVIDSLPVRCVGEWAIQKIYHLLQYFNIFTKGMTAKWDGKINYIEICSGPGRCVNRQSGYEFDGTPLSIIQSEGFKCLNKALFFDYSENVISILQSRIKANNVSNACAMIGDYYYPEKICDDIIRETKGTGLYLVFIDPTDCSVPFVLLETLKRRLKNVDFIINSAIRTDFNRNIRNAIDFPETHKNVISKYKSFLGSDDFFDNPKIETSSPKQLRLMFRDSYIKSLSKIGYQFFDFKEIGNYYDLVFASTHSRGIDFWKKANDIHYNGQRKLF